MEELLVFKIGGRILDKKDELEDFLNGFADLPMKKLIVHGGGVFADEMAKKLGLDVRMHQGRRITDEATRDLVTMVYGGLLNKQIVGRLQALGCDAIGLTGADGRLIRGERRRPDPVDYGYVGDVVEVRTDWLRSLLDANMVPVIAPLSWERSTGEILNSNADGVACKLTESLSARYETSLLYCFDKPGVLKDVENPQSLLPQLDVREYEKLKQASLVKDGMLPKLDSCFRAKTMGAHRVLLSSPHESLSFVMGKDYQGTLITSTDLI